MLWHGYRFAVVFQNSSTLSIATFHDKLAETTELQFGASK